jgi:hypothetical protein
VRDYRCIFYKRERLQDGLTPMQRIEVCYRAHPHSVSLRWLENAGDARRVIYVRGRARDADGQEMAWIQPAGCIARLFVSKVRLPIHGPRARAASRRSLDQLGFLGTFASLAQVHQRAAAAGELDLRCAGTGEIDGRPTYVLTRRLPYTGESGAYPNALLILHLDREWLLPVGTYMYADHAGTKLLGSYTMTDVTINVGLTDADFEP